MRMSQKNRKKRQVVQAPMRTPLSRRILRANRRFMMENVRTMLLFAGAATLLQAFMPWGTVDRIPFIAAGSLFLGLGIPRWMWKR